MSIEVRQLGMNLAAEIVGVDVSEPIADADVAAIEAAFVALKVLLFREQPLDAHQLAAFGAHFGELQVHVQKRYQHPDVPEVVRMTNRNADGSFDEVGAARGSADRTRDAWHSDMMFDPSPAKATLLHAVDVVSSGGHTCFSNATEVYRLLPIETQKSLIGLKAEFAYGGGAINERNALAAQALSEEDRKASVAIHPAIAAHPMTGEPAVYLSPYTTSRILDVSEEEADVLLEPVYALMDSQPVRWEHRWSAGDTLMWDNRSGLMHAGRMDYPRNEARTFIRTTVRGGPIQAYAPAKGAGSDCVVVDRGK